MIWDFSTMGWQAAVKEFFVSLGKTVLAAVAGAVGSFLLTQIDLVSVVVSTQSEYYGLILALSGVARGLISSFLKWVNSHNFGETGI